MSNISKIIFCVLVFSTFMGCVGKEQGEEQSEMNTPEKEYTSPQDQKLISYLYYYVPTPDEMLKFIKDGQILYHNELPNPIKNNSKYFDSRSQALNLGIYSADMAYLVLYGKNQEILEYFMGLQELSEKVGISGTLSLPIANKIKNNLGNIDSLKTISGESYFTLVNFMIQDKKERTLALIFSGAFIESLYIALNVLGDNIGNDVKNKRIADQKYSLTNLLQYLKKFKHDAKIGDVYLKLVQIGNVFKQFEAIQTSSGTGNEKTGEDIKADRSIMLTDNQINMLQKTVNEIRTWVVEGS